MEVRLRIFARKGGRPDTAKPKLECTQVGKLRQLCVEILRKILGRPRAPLRVGQKNGVGAPSRCAAF
jgi:hypothetical protein